ncbi:MAG: D-amino acid dehydrogenase small subunit [Pseudomonadota bacterium]|jgi:D-amino-acid dehydrogenase
MNFLDTSRQVTVLGAGMVGVSCALALQAKGWQVTLVDKRGPGEETSAGNAGVLSRSSLLPFNRPGLWQTLPRMLLKPGPSLQVRPSALAHWRFMWRFLWHARRQSFAATTVALDGLIQLSAQTHKTWLAQTAQQHRLRENGWLWLFQNEAAWAGSVFSREVLQEFSVATAVLRGAEIQSLEPHLSSQFQHALWIQDAASVDNPAAVVKAYADQFLKLGGVFRHSDVRALQQQPQGWQWQDASGSPHWTPNLVLAMGPWSESLLEASQLPSQFKAHMAFERGYHRHFKPVGGVHLQRPVYDTAGAYVLSPMVNAQGEPVFRMTTGVELAGRDAAPNTAQLEAAENAVRRAIPLKEAVAGSDWMGSRPTTPDSRPVIGEMPQCPGLWLAFGHQHIGFSTGPGTGVLLAELMAGESTSIHSAPFSPTRFS